MGEVRRVIEGMQRARWDDGFINQRLMGFGVAAVLTACVVTVHSALRLFA